MLSTGHHVREVMNADLVATNYKFLEYRAIAIGELLPAYPNEQIRKIKHLKRYKTRGRASRIQAETELRDDQPEAAPVPSPPGRLARLRKAWHG